MKWNISIWLLFLFPVFVLGQEPDITPYSQKDNMFSDAQEYYEREPLSGPSADPNWMKNEADKLNFDEETAPEPREKKRAREMPKSTVTPISTGGGVSAQLIYWIAFAALVVGLVLLLFKLGVTGSAENDEDLKIESETIDADRLKRMRVDDELSLALQQQNLRLAIRVLFLKNLKLLMEKGWIYPAAEKTNMDYVRELVGRKQQGDFVHVTQIFEVVWYGDAHLDDTVFQRIKREFERTYDLINQGV